MKDWEGIYSAMSCLQERCAVVADIFWTLKSLPASYFWFTRPSDQGPLRGSGYETITPHADTIDPDLILLIPNVNMEMTDNKNTNDNTDNSDNNTME